LEHSRIKYVLEHVQVNDGIKMKLWKWKETWRESTRLLSPRLQRVSLRDVVRMEMYFKVAINNAEQGFDVTFLNYRHR